MNNMYDINFYLRMYKSEATAVKCKSFVFKCLFHIKYTSLIIYFNVFLNWHFTTCIQNTLDESVYDRIDSYYQSVFTYTRNEIKVDNRASTIVKSSA